MRLPDNNDYFRRHKVHSAPFVHLVLCTLHRVPCCTLLLLLFFLPCHSQEATIPLTYQSTVVGYGRGNVYDSYLSQMKYEGQNVGIYYEQMQMSNLANGQISTQHLLSGNYAWDSNLSETASYYTGIFEYDYGMYYRFKPAQKLQIFAGAQAGGLLGFIYNTRNGNNPATGKFHLNLKLSAMASYSVKIKSQALLFRYQLSTPFAGIMYSPQFGQSYYEIALGDNEDLVHFASFHNYLAVKNRLSMEIPLSWVTFRLDFINSLYETRINSLDTRINTNTFCVGISKNFYVVRGKNPDKKAYRYVFE